MIFHISSRNNLGECSLLAFTMWPETSRVTEYLKHTHRYNLLTSSNSPVLTNISKMCLINQAALLCIVFLSFSASCGSRLNSAISMCTSATLLNKCSLQITVYSHFVETACSRLDAHLSCIYLLLLLLLLLI